jgi:hypothetical protein
MGISISSAVMQQTLRSQLAARLPSGDQAREIEDRVRENLDYIKELPPFLAGQVRRSYQLSLLAAFAPTLVFGLAAFAATFWVKGKNLKK